MLLPYEITKCRGKVREKKINIDSNREVVVVEVVPWVGMVDEIVEAAVVEDPLAIQEVAVDASRLEVVVAVEVEIVQIAGVAERLWKKAVAAEEIDPEVVHLHSNEEVGPSFLELPVAIETTVRALAATEVAYQAVKEDVLPWTSEVKVVEVYLMEENHSMEAVERVAVEGDPLVVLV